MNTLLLSEIKVPAAQLAKAIEVQTWCEAIPGDMDNYHGWPGGSFFEQFEALMSDLLEGVDIEHTIYNTVTGEVLENVRKMKDGALVYEVTMDDAQVYTFKLVAE